MAWTLKYKGQAQTMEAWGLCALKRRLRSEGQDEVTFYQPLHTTKDAAKFDEDEEIRIYQDGRQWFAGNNLRPKRTVTARVKRIYYTVAGPWNRFTRRVFQQQWDGTYSGHLLLNVNSSRQLVSVGTQIGVVIDYLIAQGVPITKGNILPDADETVFPPPDEVVNQSCAAVIVNQMRWLLRQGIIYWDYSTEKPTIHIRAGKKLPVVTLDIPASDTQKTIVSADLEPRTDLQLPGVWITYEITHSVNGVQSFGLQHDHYPPGITGQEEDVLHLTFDMQGINKTTLDQPVEVVDIDAANTNEATRLSWWKERCAELRNPKITNLKIEVADVARESFLPRMLTSGVLAEWMKHDGGAPVAFQDETIIAQASWEEVDDGDTTTKYPAKKKQIQCTVTATDATSRSYSTVQTVEAADPIPVGLAQFLYELNEAAQWEGVVTLKERALRYPEGEVPRLGTRLNITNGVTEWATMKAVIQLAEEDARTGETVLTVQPMSTLTAAELMEFLRVRNRRRWTNPLTQQNGTLSANKVTLPTAVRLENSSSGGGAPSISVVKDGAKQIVQNAEAEKFEVNFSGTKKATLQASDANWTKPMKVQKVCVKVGAEFMEMQVFGSDPYKPA